MKKDDDKHLFDDIQKDLSSLLKEKYNINAIFGFEQETPEVPADTVINEDNIDLNIDFSYKPKDIKKYLDRFVIKQEEAKKALAISICDHYNHIAAQQKNNTKNTYVKQNIIMVGPTGVGKTYLIKTIADLIGVPFIKADATKYSETGYVGGDVEDLVRQLVKKANGNVELAEYGIIYLDEIDKIAGTSHTHSKDVSGRGVQSNMLKLMEETEVPLSTPWDIQSQMQNLMSGKKKSTKETVNTKHILFIVSGVFDGLNDLIKKRLKGGQIGFLGQETKEMDEFETLMKTTTQDLIKFGFEPEFMGRLPVRVFCQNLNKDDLFKILKYSEGSLLRQYIESFNNYGIDVIFEDCALEEIAEQAEKEKTGARSIGTILERTFRDFKFELPSTEIKHFIATKDLIDNPKEVLKKLLEEPNISEEKYYQLKLEKTFEEISNNISSLRISISTEATDYILDKCNRENIDIKDYIQELFEKYKYGINLINKNAPDKEFIIDMDILNNPDEVMEQRIKESFKQNKS